MLPGLLLLTAALPAAPAPPLNNLSFASGRLTHWEGTGFAVGPAAGSGPSVRMGVCSGDSGRAGRKALLHRSFVVPPGISAIRFRAAAVRPRDLADGPSLDVLLEAADRRYVPKQERGPDGWHKVERVRALGRSQPAEYSFPVEHLAGRWVRLLLLDDDDRPGCFLVCSGFRLVPREEVEFEDFSRTMRTLARDKDLRAPERYESRHFAALSNAEEAFTERGLYYCEMNRTLFFEHFRTRGFAVREPRGRLMIAMFDSQAGFEAYLGQRIPATLTGMYHRDSNRLVVYDYSTNRSFTQAVQRGTEQAKRVEGDLPRRRVFDEFSRQARDFRDDTNTSTLMHEVAHQLSFNGGLLNRAGDVPVWLAEGLACYCEPTRGGSWQGPGEPNAPRSRTLAQAGRLLPLRQLVENDDWLRRATTSDTILLGYAQSWALFRFLMDERPQALRRYLSLIDERRSVDHRLADFGEAFGSPDKLEARFQAYVKEVLAREGR